jgi:hypothetical protein
VLVVLGFARAHLRSPSLEKRQVRLGAVANRCSEVLLRITEPPQAPPGEPAAQVFRRDGEFWTGKEIRLRDMRGLHYLLPVSKLGSRRLEKELAQSRLQFVLRFL